jgi:replicative DNA helicase
MDITYRNTHKTLENSDAERGFLACCGRSTEILHDAQDEVTEDWFTQPLHRAIWRKLLELQDEGDCLDIVVQFEFPQEEQQDVRNVFEAVETTGQWKFFLDKIRQSKKYREVRQYVMKLSDLVAEHKPIEEVLNEADRGATQLLQADSAKIRTGADISRSVIQRIKERQEKGSILGVKSGITRLDYMTHGFSAGQLCVIAARTSVGKTAFATELAVAALKASQKVYFISLEMEGEEVMQRMHVNHSGVPIKPIEDNTASDDQKQKFMNTCKWFDKARYDETLWIDDDSCLSFSQIRARARKISRSGLDMIIVDYAQIVQSDAGRETESDYVRVSYVSRSMKILARELGVPVILLAQLSRKADEPNRKPRLSDLKESGGLEQDADIVMMLWKKEEDEPTKRVLTVAKQRNGRVGDIDLVFTPHLQQFSQPPTIG